MEVRILREMESVKVQVYGVKKRCKQQYKAHNLSFTVCGWVIAASWIILPYHLVLVTLVKFGNYHLRWCWQKGVLLVTKTVKRAVLESLLGFVYLVYWIAEYSCSWDWVAVWIFGCFCSLVRCCNGCELVCPVLLESWEFAKFYFWVWFWRACRVVFRVSEL